MHWGGSNFQFLWGWNRIKAFPLSSSIQTDFQFLWGWNANMISSGDIQTLRNNFQFLWGWNPDYLFVLSDHGWLDLSIPLRMKQEWYEILRQNYIALSIPLRMKHSIVHNGGDSTICFQFLWGWNDRDGILLVDGEKLTFNSFEDETQICRVFREIRLRLSIPLRMKQYDYPTTNKDTYIVFQFLWGWNLSKRYTEWDGEVVWLSIPLRMKPTWCIYPHLDSL